MLSTIRSKQFLTEIFAGLVISFLLLTYVQSVTCLVFTGEARSYLSFGLFTSLAASLFLTGYLHIRGAPKQSIYLVQDLPAVIIAMAIPGLFSEMAQLNTSYSSLSTLVALIAMYSLILGFSLYFGGLLKLGNIVRYFPFTVMVGFLGGVCLLLMKGSISIIMNLPVDYEFITHTAWSFEAIVRWQPVVLFGILLFCAVRIIPSPLTLPALLVAGIILFFCIIFSLDLSIENAKELGLLMDVGEGKSMSDLIGNDLHPSHVHWDLVANYLGYSLIIVLIVFVNMILNATTYESTFDRNYPLNWELKQCGIGNIVNSAIGALPSYSTLLSIALCNILGATTRLPAMLCLATFFIALLLGDNIYSFIPIPIMASLTFYIGIHFFVDLLVDKKKQLSSPEYILVIISSLVIALWNLPIGILIALVGMAFLFVFEYSRMRVVMQELDGCVYTSSVERPTADQKALQARGKMLYILRIQGYVFFGTASRVMNKLQTRLSSTKLPPLSTLVLDFECVNKIDYSAILHLKKIVNLAKSTPFNLLYAGLNSDIERQMKDGGCIEENEKNIYTFNKFDECVQHFENRQLEQLETFHEDPMKEMLHEIFTNNWEIDFFESLLEEQVIPVDKKIFRHGDLSTGMYFIKSGEVEIWAESRYEEGMIKLSTLHPGTYFGEMAFFTDAPRSASAIATKKSKLYFLSKDHMKTIQLENINLFIKFQAYIIRKLAYRLNRSNEECYFLIQTYSGG